MIRSPPSDREHTHQTVRIKLGVKRAEQRREMTMTFRNTIVIVVILAFQQSRLVFPSPLPARAPGNPPAKILTELPLRFEANDGQASPEVKFLAHGNGYAFWLTRTDAVIALPKSVVLRMRPAGNTASAVEGLDELPGWSNYFQGDNPAQWRTNLAAYAKVRYSGVYPGVDLVYYGNGRQLEYDFIVAAGASARSIGIVLEGAERMRVGANGDLVLLAKGQEIRLRKPTAYQELRGARHEVAARYVLRGRQVQFQLEPYDTAEPLIIDPVLSYSTYLGGTGADIASSIAVDVAGNIYIAGSTASNNFPTSNALTSNSPAQTLCSGGGFAGPGCTYAFVTKVSADGSRLIYSSYIGGFGADSANGIAVDSFGNAYVTGGASPRFPTVAPIMNQGGAFALKLNSTGSALIYSTRFGGSNPNEGTDYSYGIAVDANGEAYVTGQAQLSDFPTVNPLPLSACSTTGSPFVTKFNAGGSALVFSTCLPASEFSAGTAIAVDASGSAYVTGQLGGDFISRNSIDAFVTKLDAAGSMVYSTPFGGSQRDTGAGIAVDSTGNAYVTGSTASPDFPVVNPFQAVLAPAITAPDLSDAFVTKLNPVGSIIYSTFLGGNGLDFGDAIALDSEGNIYVSGGTTSSNFPTVSAIQSAPGGNMDGFVAELTADGSTLFFSSYLGGSGSERANAMVLDAAGNMNVTGSTTSGDFPTIRPLQPVYQGGGDVFITRIGGLAIPAPLPTITSMSPNAASVGSLFTATVSGRNLTSPLSVSISGDGVTATVQTGSDSANLIFTVRVANDASVGTRSLTVALASGIVTMTEALLIQNAAVPATTPLPIPEVETGTIRSGYVIVTPDAGSSAPVSTMTYGMVSSGMVQSQTAILPTALTTESSLQVDVLPSAGRNLGLAVANASGSGSTITLVLRNQDGTAAGSPAVIDIAPGQQWARFVTEIFQPSILGSAFRGSVDIQSSVPVSLIGLHFSGIEFSTGPVVPNSPAAVPLLTLSGRSIGGSNAVMFSQFAMAGGWATVLGLVNTTSSTISGRIDIFDTLGNPMAVKLNGATQSTFSYSIPAKGTFTLAPRDENGQSPF